MILGQRSLTHRQFSAGSRGSDGRWADGSSTDTTILGSLQPVTGDALEQLPEGLRKRGVRTLLTTTTLQTVGASTSPDQIIDGSDVWEIHDVQKIDAVLPHTEALLVKVVTK